MDLGFGGFQADGRFHVKKRWTFLQGGEILGGGFKDLLFSALPAAMIQFD